MGRFRFQKGYCNASKRGRAFHEPGDGCGAFAIGHPHQRSCTGPNYDPISERLQLPQEQREPVKQKLNSTVPLGRYGQAEEVAKVVLLLASDESSYVNASEIVVDGDVTGALFGAPVYREPPGHSRVGYSKIPPGAALNRFIKGPYSLATICSQRVPAMIPLLLLAGRKWVLATPAQIPNTSP